MKTMEMILLALTLALSACSPAKLDTANEEATKAAIEQINSGLSTEQKADFQKAITDALGEYMFSGGGGLTSLIAGGQPSLSVALKRYNGKTGPEIIAEHQAQIVAREAERAAKQAKRKAELEAKLSELQAANAQRIQALERLKLIKVEDAQINAVGRGFLTRHVLVGKITNGSDVTLTTININFRVISPGREVPWNEGDGTFFIDGGLQKGETRSDEAHQSGVLAMSGYLLAANAMQEHPEAVLEWAVVDASGVDKKSILPTDPSREIESIASQIKAMNP